MSRDRLAYPRRPSAIALALPLAAALAPAGGCRSGSGAAPDSDGAAGFSRAELLGAFGSCAAAGAREFRDRAVALDDAVVALGAAPGDDTRSAARETFRRAMGSWQVMDQMQFGPTAQNNKPGGQDHRDNIYGWPLFGRCAIEEDIVARTYESPSFGTVLTANRRGLGAVEYLLFYEGEDTECAATSPTYAAWIALPAEERAARKRAYAAAATRDVRAHAVALDDAWDPAKMNFVQTMRAAGGGGSVYRSPQAAIESVGISLFFLDMAVKDRKLTEPLDAADCANATCLESRFAGLSRANVRANLDGLRRIIDGCEAGYTGLGFDDLLVAVGAPDHAEALHAATVESLARLDAIEEPDLDQALAQDRASVVALRDAIRVVTTLLKTDFVNVLGFEPSIVPTDND
jgi:predicted lipoprotein